MAGAAARATAPAVIFVAILALTTACSKIEVVPTPGADSVATSSSYDARRSVLGFAGARAERR